MKNTSMLWIAAIAVAMSACKEDKTEPGIPVQTGDEISFGTSQSGNGVGSRTSYGDEYTGEDGKQYVKINWVQDDQIAIYCPQASQPASHRVDYKITPGEDPTTSSAVTKINTDEAGLQWGTENLHQFYGFYPANRLNKVESGKLYASVPVDQQPVKWTYDEASKTWTGEPDMDYAYMYAYNEVNKTDMTQGADVPLNFHPLVTVLEVTVNGPSNGEMTISNVNINAVQGENVVLTGEFYCDLSATAGEGHLGDCRPSGDMGAVRNRVSVTCYNPETKKFISLKAGEKLKVKAFFIPNDDQTIHPQQLQVSVSPLNGANFTRTLNQADILPHKLNRVVLATLGEPGINYWMSSLDPDIFVTELSIPGSKMSMLSATNGSSIEYQHTSVSDQFDLGVRAFICQTGADYDYYWLFGDNYTFKNLYVAIGEQRHTQTVGQFLEELSDKLKEAQKKGKYNEFVVVNLTYSTGATSNIVGSDKDYAWIKTIEKCLQDYVGDPDILVYGTDPNEDITPNTTINDVKGKIIVKVNVNNTDMGNNLSGTEMPAMFALWEHPYVENGVSLKWGTSQSLNEASDMTWLYQEQTNVEGTNSEGTLDEKENNIQKLFDKSLEFYQSGTHNTWFMNDLGGFYKTQDTQGVKNLASILNPDFFDKIQVRTENAGLGLIYMNFADNKDGYGKEYQSPELIQTIIDNNFKFQLRKKGDNQSGTRTGNISRTNGNGWDE